MLPLSIEKLLPYHFEMGIKSPHFVQQERSILAIFLKILLAHRKLTIIKTSEKAGENSFEYLSALQKYESAIRAEPEKWLPWNYRANIKTLKNNSTSL